MTDTTTSPDDDHPAIRPILLVDDSAQDLELATVALQLCGAVNPVVMATGADEAIEYLSNPALEPPAAVVADLKMPRMDGLGLLNWIRGHPAHARLPVVMLTASREPKDLERCYNGGANAYVVKSMDFIAFVNAMGDLIKFWQVRNSPPPSEYPIGT